MTTLPKARERSLIVEELDDETLVYDRIHDRAHCLNLCAATVWRAADGETTVAEMASRLRELGLPHDESVVRMAVYRLRNAGLLEEGEKASAEDRPVTRKEVLRVLGRAAGIALILPAVTSVTAPLAAQAASCVTSTQCSEMRPPDCTGLPICGRRNRCCQQSRRGGFGRGRGRNSRCRVQRC